jgi:hypothetical protein
MNIAHSTSHIYKVQFIHQPISAIILKSRQLGNMKAEENLFWGGGVGLSDAMVKENIRKQNIGHYFNMFHPSCGIQPIYSGDNI